MHYYDLYLSIGYACRPSYHLKVNDLRNGAYPLDWQLAYSLDTVIHLFKTNFVDFFVDIEEEQAAIENKNRRIRDVKNDIISIHHFSKNMELEEAHRVFIEKMKERFKKSDEQLKNSKRVILICNRTDSIEKLRSFLQEFLALYPHLEIKLINMRHNENLGRDAYTTDEYVLSDKLSIEEHTLNDTFSDTDEERDDWRGNVDVWAQILKNYYHPYNAEMMHKLRGVGKDIIIYGAGKQCMMLLQKFDKYNMQIKGIAVNDIANNPKTIRKYPVDLIDKYDKDSVVVISLADRTKVEMIKRTLTSKGYYNIYGVNESLIIESL